jgi:hypothetical protein
VVDLGPNARAVKGSISDLADLDRLYARTNHIVMAWLWTTSLANTSFVISQLHATLGHLETTCEALAYCHPRYIYCGCVGLRLARVATSIEPFLPPISQSQLDWSGVGRRHLDAPLH